MCKDLMITAYPKVNLHLAVGEKRQDGFHEISSIFYLVDDSEYKDELSISVSESKKTSISVSGLDGIADAQNNTIYKAVEGFLKQTGLSALVSIVVKKGIPSGSGLGGASSDAAAVLLALNSLFPVDMKVLLNIALSVGSDVPFFLFGCKAAIVCGRGELVIPLEAKSIRIKLYPNNEEKMSTSEAYRLLDKFKRQKIQSVEELFNMYNAPVESWSLYNDFEKVNKPCSNPAMKLTGSGTCRYTIQNLYMRNFQN